MSWLTSVNCYPLVTAGDWCLPRNGKEVKEVKERRGKRIIIEGTKEVRR
jgi:hypothetical protein